jgi:Protein of unknown function (DUF2927)
VTRRLALAACALLLAACGGREPQASRLPQAATDLPPIRTFGAVAATPPQRSNAAMAQDFMDLTFRMESGRAVPVLTRFEGPVTIRMTGRVPPTAPADLARVVARLRAEAGIDVTQTQDTGAAITVEFLPRHTLASLVPQAACFVAPRISSWSEYRRARRNGDDDWTTLTTRDHAAIFIPNDIAPQEVRDCLNEELAQALGPLNDLYRLPDSVFNDDNIQSVLTGFDMLMLRATYAPDLHSGMTPAAVASLLPQVLGRYNPGGGGGLSGASDTPRAYITAIETALGPRAGVTERRAAARRATGIADAQGWQDGRAGFAWFVLGRLSAGSDPDAGLAALRRAEAIYGASPVTSLHMAHVQMQLAAFALSQGQADDAIARADAGLGPAMRAQNAALTATLMMVKAEALTLNGQTAAARALRLDSLGWARYGFGSNAEVARRLADIASLSPVRRTASE